MNVSWFGRARRRVAGIAALALVGGLNAGLAKAAVPDLTAELTLGPANIYLQAVDGQNLLVSFNADPDGSNGKYFRSTDGGSHWTAAEALNAICSDGCSAMTPADGQVVMTSGSTYWLYSMVDNQVGASVVPDPDFDQVTDGLGARLLGSTESSGSWFMDLAEPDPSHHALPSGPSYQALSATGALSITGSDADGYVITDTTTADTPTSTALKSVTGPYWNLSQAGGVVYYTSGSQACFFALAQPADGGCADVELDTARFTDAGMLSLETGSAYWRSISNWSSSVPVSAITDFDADRVGSQAQGMPCFVNSANQLRQVNIDGTTSLVSVLEWETPLWLTSLSLTPTAVLGMDQNSAWSRSVGSSLGGEQSVVTPSEHASAVASAGRWAVPTGDGAKLYDGGAKVATITDKLTYQLQKASGPYLLVESLDAGETDPHADVSTVVRMPDGSTRGEAQARDQFGSLTLRDGVADGEVTVVDLTGETPDINVTMTLPPHLPDSDSWSGGEQLWGDWIAANQSGSTVTDPDLTQVAVHNFRDSTKTDRTHPGHLMALGDGYAVIEEWVNDAAVVEVWDFLTDTTTTLTGARGNAVLGIDGNRVAFPDYREGLLRVRTLDGVATSAPRNLGAVAKSAFNPSQGSWSAQIDLTKPVAAGELQIRNSDNDLVRSITVPASSSGSLRGILWDGKGDDGRYVSSGTYRYQLTNTATDGSGTVVAVDGVDRPLGSVTVNLPTITAATPVITGVAAVGATLTVNPGSWTSGVEFSYQWLRDGSPIPGATQQAYQLTAQDAGTSISVKVTGALLNGAVSSPSTSAQVTISRPLAATPVPTVTGTWKYRSTVKVSPGSWQPAPVDLTYQWLRDGKAIGGATGTSYALSISDVGHLVSVRVTGSKAGYGSAQSLSAAHVVSPATFTRVSVPAISGKAKVGKTLAAKISSWSPSASFSYQWLRNGKAIRGATKSKYKLTKSDKGKKISVRVVGKASGYAAVTKTSKAVKAK